MNDNVIIKIIKWYKRPHKSWLADFLESLIVIIPVVFLIKTFIFGLYQVPTCSMETTMLVGERFFADKLTPYFYKPKRGEIISFNTPEYKYSDNWWKNMYEQYVDWNVVNYTKRVIAVPGDHIQGKIEDGKPVVYLNGEKLHEPYLNKNQIALVAKVPSHMLRTGYPELVHRSYDPSVSLKDQPYYRFTQKEMSLGKKYGGDNFILHPDKPAYSFDGKTKDEYDVHLGPNEYWMMGDNRQGSSDSRSWGPLDTSKIIWHGRILFRIWSLDSDESWWIFDLLVHPIDFWTRVRWNRFFQVLR